MRRRAFESYIAHHRKIKNSFTKVEEFFYCLQKVLNNGLIVNKFYKKIAFYMKYVIIIQLFFNLYFIYLYLLKIQMHKCQC